MRWTSETGVGGEDGMEGTVPSIMIQKERKRKCLAEDRDYDSRA